MLHIASEPHIINYQWNHSAIYIDNGLKFNLNMKNTFISHYASPFFSKPKRILHYLSFQIDSEQNCSTTGAYHYDSSLKVSMGEHSKKMLEKLIPLIQGCKDQVALLKAKMEPSKAGHHKKSASVTQGKFAQILSRPDDSKKQHQKHDKAQNHTVLSYKPYHPPESAINRTIRGNESAVRIHTRTKSDVHVPDTHAKPPIEAHYKVQAQLLANRKYSTKQTYKSIRKEATVLTTPSSPAKASKVYVATDVKTKKLLTDTTKTNIVPSSERVSKMVSVLKEKLELTDVAVGDEKKVVPPHKSAQRLPGWHKRCASDGYCIIPTDPCTNKNPYLANEAYRSGKEKEIKRSTSTADHFAVPLPKKASEGTASTKKLNNVTSLLPNKKVVDASFNNSKPSKGLHKKTLSEFQFPSNKENESNKFSKYHQYESLSKKKDETVLKVTKGYFTNSKLISVPQNDVKVLPRKVPCTLPPSVRASPECKPSPLPFKLPKEAGKVIDLIKSYFRTNGTTPPTTTELYRIGRLLGKGAFGKVNLGMHKLTGQMVAIKSINKEFLTDEHSKRKVMQEFSILKLLHHPSVIKLYETFESKKHILFVIELCAGGDLLNYVRRRRKLKENVAKYIFKQLIEGLQHCHSRGILHRDIKLDNVLLNAKGDIKICDFGVSKIVKKGEKMMEQCGTPAYIAPEILRDKGYEGFAVDIWSAGVALYAMLYGTVPFKANNMRDLHKMIMKGSYSLKEDVSKEARDLLRRMLECNPRRRITIPEILGHTWMANVEKSIEMFTEAEKDSIVKDFSCSKRVKAEGEDTVLFTEQNIDSTQNDLTRNITTKSIILAPFNSTQSDLSETKYRQARVYEKGEILKFGAKVRDADRQYEKNNNGDLDNGVYNKMVCATHQKSVSSSGCNSINTSFENTGREEAPECIKRKTSCCRAISEGCQQNDTETPPLVISMTFELLNKNVDEEVIKKMEGYGYPKTYVTKCLKTNELNYATSTYYLLANH